MTTITQNRKIMTENEALDLLEEFMEVNPTLNSLNLIANKFNQKYPDVGFKVSYLLGMLVEIRGSVKAIKTLYPKKPNYKLIKKGYMKDDMKNIINIGGDNNGNINQDLRSDKIKNTSTPTITLSKAEFNLMDKVILPIIIGVTIAFIVFKMGWV